MLAARSQLPATFHNQSTRSVLGSILRLYNQPTQRSHFSASQRTMAAATGKARTALDETSKTGEFKRTDAGFRNQIAPGTRFEPEGELNGGRGAWHGDSAPHQAPPPPHTHHPALPSPPFPPSPSQRVATTCTCLWPAPGPAAAWQCCT